MILDLYHGRTDLNADMDDWGFQGPVLQDVKQLQWTYGHLYVLFEDEEKCEAARKLTGWRDGPFECSLEMMQDGDMVTTQHPEGEKFYGDWYIRHEMPKEEEAP